MHGRYGADVLEKDYIERSHPTVDLKRKQMVLNISARYEPVGDTHDYWGDFERNSPDKLKIYFLDGPTQHLCVFIGVSGEFGGHIHTMTYHGSHMTMSVHIWKVLAGIVTVEDESAVMYPEIIRTYAQRHNVVDPIKTSELAKQKEIVRDLKDELVIRMAEIERLNAQLANRRVHTMSKSVMYSDWGDSAATAVYTPPPYAKSSY